MKALVSLFGWRYAESLVALLRQKDYGAWAFLKTYWRTQNFNVFAPGSKQLTKIERMLVAGLRLGMLVQLLAGVVLIALWQWHDLRGGWQFGLATILSYPIVWAHLMALAIALRRLTQPKKLGRAVVCSILEHQIRKLRARHSFKVVAVIGSVGKTSTKAAIAKTLGASQRVVWQEGNYNDRVTVPLIFFNQQEPNILNVFSWLRIFYQNSRMIRRPYSYDVVVAEIGPDGPNQMKYFEYIRPDLLVMTAITIEHMAYFKTLDAIAAEELTLLPFAEQVLINIDDTPAKYLSGYKYLSYGLTASATYYAASRKTHGLDGQTITFRLGKAHDIEAKVAMLGEQGAKAAVAAAAVADFLGLTPKEIKAGLEQITPLAGRMQLLKGIKNSTLIDDSYNASPIAVKAALDVLQGTKAPQRIAILGNMNDLIEYSEAEHTAIGTHCNAKKLDLVVTIGPDANRWLAPAAEAQGCRVKSFTSPYDAGNFVKSEIKEGAVVLAKGSQNGVFSEEALKPLLADAADAQKLVRQSAYWLAVKQKQFKP